MPKRLTGKKVQIEIVGIGSNRKLYGIGSIKMSAAGDIYQIYKGLGVRQASVEEAQGRKHVYYISGRIYFCQEGRANIKIPMASSI